jgi:hypothetical protein
MVVVVVVVVVAGGEHFNTWLTAKSCLSRGISSVAFLIAENKDVLSVISVSAHLAGKNFL